jgi:DNA invertase Pin-like site-specific DNA recombinase
MPRTKSAPHQPLPTLNTSVLPSPLRIAIYVRISKDDVQTMAGVQRQEKLCRELIAMRYPGEHTIEVYCDNNISAWSGARRPAYERLMADMAAGRLDVVVCYATDRLYRLVRLLEDIITASSVNGAYVPIVGVRSGDVDLATADGRMHARMLASVAQHSSDKTSERLKDRNAEAAAKGWAPAGPAPYGYTRRPNASGGGHTYEINKPEARIVREVVASIEAGDSMVSIARALNYRGIPKRSGGEWKPDDIRRMVISPAIAGLRAHTPRSKKGKVWRQAVIGKGIWEPIVPVHRWEAIEATLGDESRRQRSPSDSYWLSTVLITEDGRPLVGSITRGSNGKDRRVYRANRCGEHPFVSIDADEVEDAMGRLLRLAGSEFVGVEVPDATEDEMALAAELETIDTELADMARRVSLSPTDPDYLLPVERNGVRTGLLERRAKVIAAMPAAQQRSILAPGQTLEDQWSELNGSDHRVMALEIVGHITVRAVGRTKTSVVDRLTFEKGLPVPGGD